MGYRTTRGHIDYHAETPPDVLRSIGVNKDNPIDSGLIGVDKTHEQIYQAPSQGAYHAVYQQPASAAPVPTPSSQEPVNYGEQPTYDNSGTYQAPQPMPAQQGDGYGYSPYQANGGYGHGPCQAPQPAPMQYESEYGAHPIQQGYGGYPSSGYFSTYRAFDRAESCQTMHHDMTAVEESPYRETQYEPTQRVEMAGHAEAGWSPDDVYTAHSVDSFQIHEFDLKESYTDTTVANDGSSLYMEPGRAMETAIQAGAVHGGDHVLIGKPNVIASSGLQMMADKVVPQGASTSVTAAGNDGAGGAHGTTGGMRAAAGGAYGTTGIGDGGVAGQAHAGLPVAENISTSTALGAAKAPVSEAGIEAHGITSAKGGETSFLSGAAPGGDGGAAALAGMKTAPAPLHVSVFQPGGGQAIAALAAQKTGGATATLKTPGTLNSSKAADVLGLTKTGAEGAAVGPIPGAGESAAVGSAATIPVPSGGGAFEAASTIGAAVSGVVASVSPVALAAAAIAVAAALVTSFLPVLFQGGGGERLANVAIQEYNHSSETVGGEKYWSAAGFGGRVAWCSCFVLWCWNECGMGRDLGVPEGAAWANSWIYWMHNDPTKGSVITNDSSYRPQPGDILVAGNYEALGGEANSEHVEIAVGELNEDGMFRVIGGNGYGDSVHDGWYVPGQYFNYVARPRWPGALSLRLRFGSGAGSGALMDGVDFSMSESEFVSHWGGRINSYFAQYFPGSPLEGHGETYARAAYNAHFDPRFLPAVASQEQSGGLIDPGLAGNYYGWGVYDSGIGAAASDGGSDIDAWIEYLMSDQAIFAGKPLVENSWEEIDAAWATDPNWGAAVSNFMSRI